MKPDYKSIKVTFPLSDLAAPLPATPLLADHLAYPFEGVYERLRAYRHTFDDDPVDTGLSWPVRHLDRENLYAAMGQLAGLPWVDPSYEFKTAVETGSYAYPFQALEALYPSAFVSSFDAAPALPSSRVLDPSWIVSAWRYVAQFQRLITGSLWPDSGSKEISTKSAEYYQEYRGEFQDLGEGSLPMIQVESEHYMAFDDETGDYTKDAYSLNTYCYSAPGAGSLAAALSSSPELDLPMTPDTLLFRVYANGNVSGETVQKRAWVARDACPSPSELKSIAEGLGVAFPSSASEDTAGQSATAYVEVVAAVYSGDWVFDPDRDKDQIPGWTSS